MKTQLMRRRVLLMTILGVGALMHNALFTPVYQLRYNATDSAPRGWYALIPVRDIEVGAFVFAQLPSRTAKLAAERGYLPDFLPILKHVAATPGHFVCARDQLIAIDRVLVGHALTRDGAGRMLEPWTACRAMEDDELFLFSDDNPTSFDSRYFGPINRTAVLGKAIPLWTW